jgi:hypothetical protein
MPPEPDAKYKKTGFLTGEEFFLKKKTNNWYEFEIEVKTRQGRYLVFQEP